MKKIMVFLYSLSGGGAERTVINLINNLNKDEYNVLLVLGTDKGNDYLYLVNDEIEVKVLKSRKLRFSIFKLRNCIIKEDPDILFSTINANNIILLIAKLLSLKKIPTIIRETSNRTQSGSVTFINKVLTTFLYNRVSTKVIALSKGVKNDLVNNFHVTENKIELIYNPVEVDKIKELSEEEIKGVNKSSEEKIIVTVGRLVDAKDHQALIKAFSKAADKIKVRLIILGKGPYEEKLKELSKTLGLEKKIHFLGFKKNPYKYMNIADVFVLSSQWEGFGHVIVEAMATGTPVISTDCNSGPREIIKENKYGILVPVGDIEELSNNIVDLLCNQKLMDYYSLSGSERAKDFSASSIIRQYERVFTECR